MWLYSCSRCFHNFFVIFCIFTVILHHCWGFFPAHGCWSWRPFLHMSSITCEYLKFYVFINFRTPYLWLTAIVTYVVCFSLLLICRQQLLYLTFSFITDPSNSSGCGWCCSRGVVTTRIQSRSWVCSSSFCGIGRECNCDFNAGRGSLTFAKSIVYCFPFWRCSCIITVSFFIHW